MTRIGRNPHSWKIVVVTYVIPGQTSSETVGNWLGDLNDSGDLASSWDPLACTDF